MKTIRRLLLVAGVAVASALTVVAVTSDRTYAATAEELSKDADLALQKLYKTNSVAEQISKQAKAVLIFPSILKAGLLLGGSYGDGVLKEGPRVVDYYSSYSASWGLQAGAQTYGYALFLMNDRAIEYINRSDGWEIGVGPSVVLVDEGIARRMTTTTLRDDAYAFVFNQSGLMGGLGMEGTKITKTKR
jgi:lipid-binding SYLF domain-containing protein